MKRSFCLILLLVIGNSLFPQATRLSNTLLWRISGKGLKKPCYLYGTMHLTDKRVFQLGDSVYKALEQTDGFAAELDMNRIGMQMLNLFLKQKEEKNAKEPDKVKDKVNSETWKLYQERLEKKFNKKSDRLTVDDLDEVESKLQVELFKKGDMPTFLDAWLFGHARKQGKWVGGIEDLEDQLEYFSDEDIEEKIQLALFDDDYYRGSLDWFIKVYTEQKLDTIDAYMYREDGKKDYIMIKRNLKMARRMDSLAAIRSTLFAVGAAHLPGDSGVIAMLRERGFTVTPVLSSKKINPDKYISKTAEGSWFPVDTKDSSYALQMPGIAEGLEFFESIGLDMKMFFDISFMKLYMTIGVELPEERRKLGTDSLFKELKNRYSAKDEKLKEKKITINGIEGREFRISMDEGELRIQIFLPRLERTIINAVFAFAEKSVNDAESGRFFQSFTYNTNYVRPEKAEMKWTRMDFPLQSFSVEMPLKPKETKDVVSEEGRISYGWQIMDISNQVFYGMNVWAMKEGMYDEGSDTVAFIAIKNRIKEGFENAEVKDSSFISMNGYPGYSLFISGKAEGEPIEAGVLSLKRGGIVYYLFAVYPLGSSSEAHGRRFLNSFRILPYNQPEWKKVISPDQSFSTSSAFSLKPKENVEDDIHPDAQRFMMYDSLAAVTGYIDKTILPEWLWYQTDTGFLRTRADEYRSWNDSIDNYRVESIGAIKIVSFTAQKPGDNLVKKVKLVLNGNELYELFGHFAQQDLPGMYDRFFDDFRVINEKKSEDRSASKINLLSKALDNAGKETVKTIGKWWDYLEFTETDIPALQRMLLRVYPDFDSSYYGNLNKKLFDKIEFLDSNHITVSFIKDHYADIEIKDEYIKPFVIAYLSGITTAESYGVLKACLTKHSLNFKGSPYFPTSFYDSLKLTATLYPEVMKIAKEESFWQKICGVTVTLIDSNLLSANAVKEYDRYFIETAKRELEKDKQEIEEGAYAYTDLIRLLGIIDTPASNDLLTSFSKFDNRELKFRTMIAMLENNLPVDKRNYLTFGMIDEYRHDLYDELKRINKLKLFPPEFLSQKRLAQSKLYLYANDDEYEADAIIDIGERTISYKDKQQKFYLFKVVYNDEDFNTSSYLAVAGPYSLNSKDMSSTHSVTGIYWDEEFDVKKTDELFRAYLKMLEDEEPTEKTPSSQEIIKQ